MTKRWRVNNEGDTYLFGALAGTTAAADNSSMIEDAMQSVVDRWSAGNGHFAQGGNLILPSGKKGKMPVSREIETLQYCHVRGSHHTATIMLALPGFTGEAVYRIGQEGQRIVSATSVSNLLIDGAGADNPGLIGIRTTAANEHSGARHVRGLALDGGFWKSEWLNGGVDGAVNNCYIEHCDDLPTTFNPARVAIEHIGPPDSMILVRNFTLYGGAIPLAQPSDPWPQQMPAGLVINGSCNLDNVHMENCTIGVDVGQATQVVMTNITGHPLSNTNIRLRPNIETVSIRGCDKQAANSLGPGMTNAMIDMDAVAYGAVDTLVPDAFAEYARNINSVGNGRHMI